MKYLLFLLGILAFLIGGAVLSQATGAIHEIEAFVLFLIGAVFLIGAAIVEALNTLQRNVTAVEDRLAKAIDRADADRRSAARVEPRLAVPKSERQ